MKRFPGWLRVKTSSIPSAMLPQHTTPSNRRPIATATTTAPATHSPTNNPSSSIFLSLARNPRPWTITRKLWSENPSDLQGELKGVATFTPKPHNGEEDVDNSNPITEMVYKEEGETAMPGLRGVAGMRWTKKYIWKLANGKKGGDDDGDDDDDSIEVWFVKITDCKATAADKDEDERDYIFHDLQFGNDGHGANDENGLLPDDKAPPEIEFPLDLQENVSSDGGGFTTLTAHGHHLCVNDTYQTIYSFRLQGEGTSTEVASWASRHVVNGPKKRQVILNVYDQQ